MQIHGFTCLTETSTHPHNNPLIDSTAALCGGRHCLAQDHASFSRKRDINHTQTNLSMNLFAKSWVYVLGRDMNPRAQQLPQQRFAEAVTVPYKIMCLSLQNIGHEAYPNEPLQELICESTGNVPDGDTSLPAMASHNEYPNFMRRLSPSCTRAL